MFCRVCGKEINDQAVICPNCGCAQQNMNQGYGGYQQGGYQLNDPNEPANGGLWTCPSCGEQNGGKSNICLSCGADKPSSATFGSSTNRMQLETTDTDGQWTCRACGKINHPGVGACLGCGRSRKDLDTQIAAAQDTVVKSKKTGVILAFVVGLVVVVGLIVCFLIVVDAHNSKPILSQIYEELGEPYYASIGSDGSWLILDTNPYDIEDIYISAAHTDIKKVLDELDMPAAYFTLMGETCALDGTQTKTHNGVTVSWTYHPDRGLRVKFYCWD